MTVVALCLTVLLAVAGFAQRPPAPPLGFRAHRISAHGHSRSYLGVGVAEIDVDRAKALNLKEERGVEVKRIDEDSPAAKTGMKEGDVVLEYNGQRVEGVSQFRRMIRETPPGRQCALLISRNGATQTLKATLNSREGREIAELRDGEDFQFVMPMPEMPDIKIPEFHIPPFHLPEAMPGTMSWHSATLGIEGESLSEQLAEFFGVKSGVLVRSVEKESAAEKAGLKAGDVITKLNGNKISDPHEMSAYLRESKSKRTFPLVVVRNRKEITLNVTLPEHSGMSATPSTV